MDENFYQEIETVYSPHTCERKMIVLCMNPQRATDFLVEVGLQNGPLRIIHHFEMDENRNCMME